MVCALLVFGAGRAAAQELQFLPEVNAHVVLDARWRVFLQAKDDRDAGASSRFSIGPSVQLHLKPLVRLKNISRFDLDDSKQRVLVLEAGYRYLSGPDSLPYSRMEATATLNFPTLIGVLMIDKSRIDLDWTHAGFCWRYRNKLTVERTVTVRTYHVIPYVAAEVYFESQYEGWATTALSAGCLVPAGRHTVFNAYFKHENLTGKPPNRQQESVGAVINLYFSRRSP